MKKYTPLSQLPQEAASLNRSFIRVWADGLVEARDYAREHKNDFQEDDLVAVAEAFIQLDDHMKAGGDLPTGWSFFSQHGKSE